MIKKLISFFSCFIFGTFALAAEVYINTQDTLSIFGAIEEGDYKKIVAKIAMNEINGGSFLVRRMIMIDSPGGSLVEAQKIGQLVSDINAGVTVFKNCHSACFWIIAAAPMRNIGAPFFPNIGLHNVYLDSKETASLSATQLAQVIQEANFSAKKSLEKLEVPNYLIDKMISRSSTELYLLTKEDTLNMGQYRPSVNQVRGTKCNADPVFERKWKEYAIGLTSDYPQLDNAPAYFEKVNSCMNRLWRRDAFDAFAKHALK